MSQRQPYSQLGRLSRTLLNRGENKLRETDWWAVLVEVAVVVLGILIAFELNEWDQRRQARAEERLVLTSIREEAAADLQALRFVRTAHERAAINFRRLALITAGQSGNEAEPSYNRVTPDPCQLERLPAVRRSAAGSGSLAATGRRLEVIQDETLRVLLRSAVAAQTFSDSQLSYFRDSFQRYAAMLEPHMRWYYAPDGTPRCRIDVAGLSADRRTSALLVKMGRDQLTFAGFRQREIIATRQVWQRVQCLQAGTCPAN